MRKIKTNLGQKKGRVTQMGGEMARSEQKRNSQSTGTKEIVLRGIGNEDLIRKSQ